MNFENKSMDTTLEKPKTVEDSKESMVAADEAVREAERIANSAPAQELIAKQQASVLKDIESLGRPEAPTSDKEAQRLELNQMANQAFDVLINDLQAQLDVDRGFLGRMVFPKGEITGCLNTMRGLKQKLGNSSAINFNFLIAQAKFASKEAKGEVKNIENNYNVLASEVLTDAEKKAKAQSESHIGFGNSPANPA